MPQQTQLLQISRSYDGCARFKCLGCGAIFSIALGSLWNFCPKCGTSIEIKPQYIPDKQYYDNFGVWQQLPGSDTWTHVKAPVFTIIVEFLSFDGEWDEFHLGKKTGNHQQLAHFVQGWRHHNPTRTRFRLISSTSLSLP